MNEHAPGWYEHEGERRYWDGVQWTQSMSVPNIPPYDPPPPIGGVPSIPPPSAPVPNLPTAYSPPPGQGPQGWDARQVPPVAPGMLPPARKEPALSVLASFFLPGLGQLLNGDTNLGVIFLCSYFGAFIFTFCGMAFFIGILGIPVIFGVWIWSMVDAYQGAVRFNQRLGYPA